MSTNCCNYVCDRCCSPPLATSYALTFSADLTIIAACCSYTHTWTGGSPYIVTWNPVTSALYGYCSWESSTTSFGDCGGTTGEWRSYLFLIRTAGSWQVNASISVSGPTYYVASIYGETTTPSACDPTDAAMAWTRSGIGGCGGASEDGSGKTVSVS